MAAASSTVDVRDRLRQIAEWGRESELAEIQALLREFAIKNYDWRVGNFNIGGKLYPLHILGPELQHVYTTDGDSVPPLAQRSNASIFTDVCGLHPRIPLDVVKVKEEIFEHLKKLSEEFPTWGHKLTEAEEIVIGDILKKQRAMSENQLLGLYSSYDPADPAVDDAVAGGAGVSGGGASVSSLEASMSSVVSSLGTDASVGLPISQRASQDSVTSIEAVAPPVARGGLGGAFAAAAGAAGPVPMVGLPGTQETEVASQR